MEKIEHLTSKRRMMHRAVHENDCINASPYCSLAMRVPSASSILIRAVENVIPSIEVVKLKRGSRTLQIPRIITRRRQLRIGMRWLIQEARQKSKKTHTSMSTCLAEALYDAYQKKGESVVKRDALHKTAHTARGNIRLSWW